MKKAFVISLVALVLVNIASIIINLWGGHAEATPVNCFALAMAGTYLVLRRLD